MDAATKAKPTRSQLHARLKKAAARSNAAMDVVYTFATDAGRTRFNECLALATDAARNEYLAASNARDEIIREGVRLGYWYRGTFDTVMWVRTRDRIGTVDY